MKFVLVAFLFLAVPFAALADDGDEEEQCRNDGWGHPCPVPEIDGATLPKAILLMVCLYIFVSSASKKRSE